MRDLSSAAVLICILMGGCCAAAPEDMVLEQTPRTVRVGKMVVSLLMPEGVELEGHYVASTRYEIPGRGGANILLTVSSADGLLLDDSIAAATKRTSCSGPCNLAYREGDDQRYLYTILGETGQALHATSRRPVPENARPRGTPYRSVGCIASLHRSSPLQNIDGKRALLEEICRSLTVVGPAPGLEAPSP